jgi:flagellar hook-associated protein FlgK
MKQLLNDTHEKNGINLIPSKRHEKGGNKFDTSIKEEVKKINDLIKKIL